MATEIIMPVFGFTQEESEIVAWLVKDGDKIDKGDPVAEVTTDKVNMEVEAPASGIFGGAQYDAGAVVPVTSIIAFILAEGEAPPKVEKKAPPTSEAPQQEESQSPVSDTSVTPTSVATGGFATPVAARMAADKGVDISQVRGTGAGGRVTRQDVENHLSQSEIQVDGKVRATPAARRVSRETGIDLAGIDGSGPRGRIQEADVRQADVVPAPLPALTRTDDSVRIPFTNMRRTIASNLQRSAQEAPHIYFQVDMDMSALSQLVDRGNQRRGEGDPKITLTAGLAKAVAWTLGRHPRLNSHLGKDEAIQYSSVHLGIAVALDEGLIVPVMKNAHYKNIQQMSAEIRDLATRAKTGKLKPDELRGGTFTISNLGMYGIDRFTAIINPPEVAILAVGRARKQFVPDANDQPVLRPMATLTLSVDHRVIDGAVAAAFMDDLRVVVEAPELMTL